MPAHSTQKFVRLGKTLLQFTTIQVIVQILGLLVSLLLVRKMPKEQYAYYTIANALLSTVLQLSDSGMTPGLQAVGGPFHNDNHRMGQLLRTGIGMRRMMYFLAAAIVLPIIPYMLFRAGAHMPTITEVLILVIVATQLQLVVSIYSAIPRLRGDIRVLQWMGIAGAGIRFLIILPAYFAHISIGLALLSQILSSAGQIYVLSRWAHRNIDMTATPDKGFRSGIWRIVKAQIPYEIYGVFQGQISVWLITIFGSANQVADLGALTRLGVVFVVVAQVINSVLTPRLSRCVTPSRLRSIYWQIFLAYVLFTGVCLSGVLMQRGLVVKMLGTQYANIHSDLVYAMVLQAIWVLQGGALALNMSRGWVVPAYFGITLTILTQVVVFQLVNLATLRGVLLAGMGVALVNLILQLLGSEYFTRQTLRLAEQPAAAG
jgi:O-antigen/teichoic acid export membrane protein